MTAVFKRLAEGILGRFGKQIVNKPPDPFEDMGKLLETVRVTVVVDGGAYHGDVSMRLRSTFPRCVVYAFEPHGESFEILRSLSERRQGIVPLQYALSSSRGSRILYRNALPATSALTLASPVGARYYRDQTRPVGQENVEATTLDDWAAEFGVGGVDVLKLDLQGHELEALKGASRLLESSVKLVYTEVEFVRLYEENCLLFEVEGFLRNKGFSLYQLYHMATGHDGRLLAADAIFVRDEGRGM